MESKNWKAYTRQRQC